MTRVLAIIFLLGCLPCAAATIYKSVDDKGRVSYSDQMPAADSLVDVLEYGETAPTLAADATARLAEMRASTDRMAADRREREESRARARLERRQRATQQVVLVEQETYYPVYGRRYHPIIRPPIRPSIRPPLSARQSPIRSQYPAKLIRQHYTSTAAQVFR
jgi:hypothetical protein